MSLSDHLQTLDRVQQSHPRLSFPAAVIKKFGDDGAGQMAALIAYYGFASLFPLLLLLVTVPGFVLEGDPKDQTEVLHSALGQFPIIGDQPPGEEVGAALAGDVPDLLEGVLRRADDAQSAQQQADDANRKRAGAAFQRVDVAL